MITVKELIKQLQTLEELGMGDAKVWYRDFNDIDHKITEGVYDTHENNVVLG
jgi:hypothetical protein